MDELEKLRQKKEALKRKERALKEKQRKAENHRKYQLGGMVVKAGFADLDDEVIIGLLFAQKEALADNDTLLEQWRSLGIQASATPEKVGVIVKFSDKPDEEVTKNLKAAKMRWNRISKQWEGSFTRDKVDHIRSIAGVENVSVIEL